MRTRAGQSGLTILGFIFVAAVLLSIAMIGFRVLPSYIEYFSVLKILKEVVDHASEAETPVQLRRHFQDRAGADYVDSIRGEDIEFSKVNNQLVATANWSKTLPLVGNVSLLIDFSATASK